MELKESLVPVVFHQAFAYFRAGETTAGKKYRQPGD
jgi:hypothetical protein